VSSVIGIDPSVRFKVLHERPSTESSLVSIVSALGTAVDAVDVRLVDALARLLHEFTTDQCACEHFGRLLVTSSEMRATVPRTE